MGSSLSSATTALRQTAFTLPEVKVGQRGGERRNPECVLVQDVLLLWKRKERKS